jgi:hypothetical protein
MLSTFYRTLLSCLALVAPLYAQTTSPELERLQAEIAPYVLPAELGSKVIPRILLDKSSAQGLIETMRSHGVEVVTSQSISDTSWNIQLRNLNLNRILEFVTQQVSAHWLYQDGRVVIFRAPTELNASYQKAYEQKLQLEQQIRTEKRRLSRLREEALKEVIILELSINNATLSQTIDQLSMATVTNGLNDGKGHNIVPLFNSKLYTDTHSYSFKNQSLSHILDTICADQQMAWKLGGDAITIDAKSPR